MRHLNIIIVFFIVIALASCNSCNNKNENIDFVKEYPDADAVYLSIVKEYTLNEDGSILYKYSHRLKFLTYLSFNRLYGESFVLYNPEYQSLNITKAETKMANGKIVPSPENAFNEVLPYDATNAPDYNHLREMVITHTGLELGAEVSFEYEILSNKDFAPALMGYESFVTSSPTRELTIIINIPKDKNLNFKIINDSNLVTETENDKYKTYKIIASNLPAYSKESHISDYSYPGISFSTIYNEGIQKYFNGLDAFKYQSTEKINNYISDLKINNTELNKAIEIQDYVVNNINNYHVSIEQAAYRVRTPEQVWQSNGGTGIEKTVLLNTILKQAGYNCKIVFVMPDHIFDNQIGNIKLLDEKYIELCIGDELFYLSAVESNKKNPDFNNDRKMFFPVDENLLHRPTGRAEMQIISVQGNLEINDINLKGKLSTTFSTKFKPDKDLEKNKNLLPLLIQGVTVRLVDFSLNENNQFIVDYNIEQQPVLTKQANYFFLSFPYSPSGISSWQIDYLNYDRTLPVSLPFMLNESYSYKIKLPSDAIMVSKDTTISINNSIGSIEMSLKKENEYCQIYRSISIKTNKIEVNQYAEFRELMNCWNNKRLKELIFKQ
ncbi:MAG: DUF3857 domain-containing protein [Bacteroidota bacterium]